MVVARKERSAVHASRVWAVAVVLAGMVTGSCDRSTPMQHRSCTDECGAGAATCDSTGARVACDEPATPDQCRTWSAPAACGPRSTCVGGECRCLSPCTTGETVCADDGHEQRCAGPDGEGCFSWGEPTACAAGLSCAGGSCGCGTPCQPGATACGPTGERLSCVGPDENGCTSWSAAACGAHLVCVAGECVCENPCQTNQYQCDGLVPALVWCSGPDENGCRFWSAPDYCLTGEVCKDQVGPAQVPSCVTYTPPLCADINECDFVGQKMCMSDSAYRECFIRESDGCLRLDCAS
jgi:hypothetical protein